MSITSGLYFTGTIRKPFVGWLRKEDPNLESRESISDNSERIKGKNYMKGEMNNV